MVIGRKNKNDNRHLLASIDEVNNGKVHQAENGNFF